MFAGLKDDYCPFGQLLTLLAVYGLQYWGVMMITVNHCMDCYVASTGLEMSELLKCSVREL